MTTVKVESVDEMEFLETAFKHVCKINECNIGCISTVMKQVEALSSENKTLELNESQEKVFRIVMQLYNDVIADYVTWADEFIQQLPVTAEDAPAFYEMLRDYHLTEFASDALSLFRYWITQDWGYFNTELLGLIEHTRNLDWLSVGHWCRRKNQSPNTKVEDEIAYYRKEYCK